MLALDERSKFRVPPKLGHGLDAVEFVAGIHRTLSVAVMNLVAVAQEFFILRRWPCVIEFALLSSQVLLSFCIGR